MISLVESRNGSGGLVKPLATLLERDFDFADALGIRFSKAFSADPLGCFLLPCKSLTFGGLMENPLVGKKLKS